jgi:protein-S-isoprenylcysteine O-methyltransferase Ste14
MHTQKAPFFVATLTTITLITLSITRVPTNGWPSAIWLMTFIITMVIRMPYAKKIRKNTIINTKKDIIDKTLLFLAFFSMMFLPLFYLGTDFLSFADYHVPNWMTFCAALAQPVYIWIFWKSHVDLGVNWSPALEIRDNHALVTTGIYAYVRHPMYVALLVSVMAQPFLLQNWIGGFLAFPIFAIKCFLRIPKEDDLMKEQFKESYDIYAQKTGRLLPRFAAKN